MKKMFGIYKGQSTHQFVLENDNVKIVLTDFGARIVSCFLKRSNADIVQGFDNPLSYENDVRYMGATVGRVANRIGKGQFEINGVQYHCPCNNNGNCLHGGIDGFDLRIFETKEEENKVIFSLVSPDMDEGFPGKLKLTVTYELLEDGFSYQTEAISDQDTCCSITNHAFFNMNGQISDTALDHWVKINADKFSAVDENGLTLPVIKSVENTPFDFKEFGCVNDHIHQDNEDLKAGNGFDHNFILNGTGLKKAVWVKGKVGVMEIETTMPCIQFYSGNFLNGQSKGKEGATYPTRSALCFEPQYFPNSINYNCAEKPLLKQGEKMKHRTDYHFKQGE